MAPSTGARTPTGWRCRAPAVARRLFRVDRVELRHEQFDGTMSHTITRILFDRGILRRIAL